MRFKISLISFGLLLLYIHFSIAQNDSIKFDKSAGEKKIWIVKGFLQDEAKLWTSPLRFSKKDWLVAAPVIISTLAIIRYDENIEKGFKDFRDQHQWVRDVSPVMTWAGDGKVVTPVSILMYAGGIIFKDSKLEQTGALAMQALMHAVIISQGIKMITSRERPYSENGIDRWRWFPTYFDSFKKGYTGANYNSHPSGHTIAAWALATVIALQYKDQWVVSVLCYTTATLVGLSRVTQNAHWFSDVMVGAALGYGIGRYMVNKRAHTKWTLFPSMWGNNVMIIANYKLGYK